MTMERRSLLEPVEARAEDGSRKIVGYGAVFNSRTVIGEDFEEEIAPNAFANSIKGDVRSFFNHNPELILGRTKSGTLRIEEDERGLRYEVDLPDTQAGRDLQVSMDRGDVDGSSFMFRVKRDKWELRDGALPLRTIQEVELYEVGPVTIPAYDDAKVALRSLEEARSRAEQEIKEHNREGFAKRKADMIREKTSEQRFRKIPGDKPEA